MLVATIASYGRRAYAACVNVGGSSYQCSGANTATQTINANNASVSTLPGFSVNTSSNSGITITGDGAISYTDTNASPVTSQYGSPVTGGALVVLSTGDAGVTPGSVTVKTNGAFKGNTTSVRAGNLGSGSTSVSLYGNLTGQLVVANSARGGDVSLYMAPGTVFRTVNNNYGVIAENYGRGSLTINALSDRIEGNGLYAKTYGSGLTVTTNNRTASGYVQGITAKNFGTGGTSITANGEITGGLYALNFSRGTSDLNVTLNSAFNGYNRNIAGGYIGAAVLRNYGTGAINLNINGYSGGASRNVVVSNSIYGTDLKVTVGKQGTYGPVIAAAHGIAAFDLRNYGSGVLTFTSYKGVFGGVSALNYGTDLTITAGGRSQFDGGIYGINHGTGKLSISLNGASAGINYRLVAPSGSPLGIYAKNYGTDLSITTAGGAYVRGTTHGIQAINKGSGALTISTGGPVLGGIVATNYGTDLGITAGAGMTVTGDIAATNKGTGALTVTANGGVTGTITATSYGSTLDITTATGTTIGGNIAATNKGTGALTVTVNGDVTGNITATNYGTTLGVTTATGTTVAAITATNKGTGVLAVTANGAVTGGVSATDYGGGLTVISAGAINGVTGINAVKHGSTGALSITTSGDVTGTGGAGSGILAKNYGATLGLTLGAGKTVSGATGVNALNYGSGGLTIMANGNVTGTAGDGIYARSSTGAIGITVASGSTVKTTGTAASNFGIETKGAAATISVAGTVAGGAGGAGISGANLTVLNSGTISGNTTAIAFTGGVNTLTLQTGWSLSGGINLATSATSVGFNQSIDVTLVNVIGGAGSVIQDGTGTLTLSGTNTFSGGTTVNSGTLAISNNSALGTGALTLSPGTTLHLEGVSITNQVNVSGDPDIAVTGTNSMPTFVGAAGTTTNILGTDNSATTDGLAVTTANAGYAGLTNVGGTSAGSAVTLKGGALNAFGGTSTMAVFAGSVLDLGGFNQAIGSLSGGGTVTNNGAAATLTTGDSTNTTFDGVLQNGTGTLSLTKAGSGTFTLSGVNTFSGATTINDGTLVVNGSTANSSLTTINSGGTLSGIGTIKALAVNGGTFAPGSGVAGTSMTVTGNATFQSGATYRVNVNPVSASATGIAGTASLTGVVNAVFASGAYVQKQYTILTALGGLSGSTFNSLTINNLPSLFSASLSYDTNDVFLNLTANPLPTANLNGNQTNVANAISTFFANGGALPPGFVSLFGLSSNAQSNAYNQLSGEPGANVGEVSVNAMNGFLNVLLDPSTGHDGSIVETVAYSGGAEPLAYANTVNKPASEAYAAVTPRDKIHSAHVDPFAARWTLWAAGYGGSGKVTGNATTGSHDVSGSVYGTAAGADYRVSPDTRVGFALGVGGFNFGVSNGLGGGRADIYQAGAYLRHNFGPAYITAAAAYAWEEVKTDRTVTVAGIDRLHASFNANVLTGRVEGGWTFAMPVVSMTPYAALQSTGFFRPNYSETAASGFSQFALNYAAQTAVVMRSEVGLRWEKAMPVGGGRLIWLATTAWAHGWHDDSIVTANASFQSLPGSPAFTVNGAAPAHDLALVSVGAKMLCANGWSLSGKLVSELASTTHNYGGQATLSYAFN